MFFHKNALLFLRLSLGFTFFWFGILKLFNVSPVIDIIRHALPAVGQSQLFFFGLALIEIAIGAAFLANRFVKIAAIVMIVHLIISTGSVIITQGFAPRFPVLSLAGEFAVKNLVLISAGLVLLAEKAEKSHKKGNPDDEKNRK